MCAKLLQLCLTHCDPMNCGTPGSSVLGILQAKILEWIAMPSSRGSYQPGDGFCSYCIADILFTTEPSGNSTYNATCDII